MTHESDRRRSLERGMVLITTLLLLLVITILALAMQISSGPVSTVPWMIGNTDVGFAYNPNNVIQSSQTGGQNTLYGLPVAYIGELGRDATYANATDYIVDAWSYGGSQATVAVVESTYQVRYAVSSATSP